LPTQIETIKVLPISSKQKEPESGNIEQFWKLELLGISESSQEKEDEVAVQHFQKTIKREKKRYSVGWPWRYRGFRLPSNFGVCFGRLISTVWKLGTQPPLLERYNEILKEQIESEITEEVKDIRKSEGPVHYLPHHAVITPMKQTKIRMVFDASVKTSGSKSLNDLLRRGPVLLNDLTGILLRFRLMNIAITCDIEKAYHQLVFNREDRDVIRFLWLRDYRQLIERSNLVVYRFQRAPFGIASPFLLVAVIKFHLRNMPSAVAKRVEENFYVDNVVAEADSIEEAIKLYEEIKDIFSKAHMNIREFASNSAEFNEFLSKEDQQSTQQMKVLGI
uniref:Reverse transcriptase domain-containing protein n=1 Tax=Gongylonema pulchrum TaxID=637853 RepID=A0A183D0M5_9BILA